jgi:hypothetical protein
MFGKQLTTGATEITENSFKFLLGALCLLSGNKFIRSNK